MSQYQNAAKFTYIFKFTMGTFVILSVLKKKESHRPVPPGTGGTLRNRLRLGIWCSNLVLAEIKSLINILQVHTPEPATGLAPSSSLMSFQKKEANVERSFRTP